MSTDEELSKDYPGIEPEWTRSREFAAAMMTKFQAEHFQCLAKLVGDYVGEHLWAMIQDHLIDDTEQNIAGFIRHRVEANVRALLGKETWFNEKYIFTNDRNAEEIRAKLVGLIPKELQDARISDLEAKVAELKKSLKYRYNHNG